MIAFTVYADPAPQGSKVTGSRKDGSRFTRESSKHVKPFRAAVRQAAAEAFERAGATAFQGPVELQVVCWYARPASHSGTGRNAGRLKPSAPRYKTSAPDLSKIVRAVEDALNGVAFTDDARVARLIAEKAYTGGVPRVLVAVDALDNTPWEEVMTDDTHAGDDGPADATRGRDRQGPQGPGGAHGGPHEPQRANRRPAAAGDGARRDEARGSRAVADQELVTAPPLF